jgi:hypothetical protein|nr:MAG TPA: minor capsid component [Caudoviricetes sp.]
MRLDKKEADEEMDVDTASVEAAFALLMRWLHRQPEFTPEMLKDEEVQQFIRTHAEVLDDAVDFSIRQRPLDDISVQRLKESNYVFSGFKTFHELNEAFPSLLDKDGNRKPFERFLNDVQKINENYNKWYLKAEYNFAMSSADMAARWQGWWDDEDRDRYLLQYRTVGDKRVRKVHRALHNVTLPITSRFWDEYFPPNGWNCRCTVARVRKGKYPESDEAQAMLAGSQATAGKHQEMMRFNPGKQMACFPAYNPYTISKCKDCPNRPGKLKLAKVPGNELCAVCKVIKEQTFIKEAKRIKEASKEAYEWVSGHVPEKGYTLPATSDNDTHELRISRGSLKDVVDHFKRPEDKMIIATLMDLLEERVYTHNALLGEGKKGDPETIKKNLKKKSDRGVVSYNYYDIRIGEEVWELNCEVYKKGFEKPYALKRKKRTD